MENVIEIQHLIKDFKDVRAVNDLSFKVKKGEFFSFLGVNGAGKSTTISIMCGKLSRNSGSVLINVLDIYKEMDQILKVLGVVYQNNVLDKVLTVYDNLKFRAGLYNITGDEFKKRYEYLASILDFKDLKKMGVSLKRAKYFITCNGKYFISPTLFKKNFIEKNLVIENQIKKTDEKEQLTLFNE